MALLFLGVMGIAGARGLAPAAPWDCKAVQVILGGVLHTDCAAVNCGANSACVKDVIEIQGVTYYYCKCTGGESTAQSCEGLFTLANPTGRICIDNACPALQPCTLQQAGAGWAPMCECTYPAI